MRCNGCGFEASAALPQCPRCQRWDTFRRWMTLGEVPNVELLRFTSGIHEIDWLVGGGLVRGCVYRIIGERGSGKSTLALDVATRTRSLYLTSEEMPAAVRLRAERLGRADSTILIGAVRGVEEISDVPADVDLVVVDSINRLASPDVAGEAGSNPQLVHAIEHIVDLAQASRGDRPPLTVLVIGHVNREGHAFGTTILDHAGDCEIVVEPQGKGLEAGRPGVVLIDGKNRHGPGDRFVHFRHGKKGLKYELPQEGNEEEGHEEEDGEAEGNPPRRRPPQEGRRPSQEGRRRPKEGGHGDRRPRR